MDSELVLIGPNIPHLNFDYGLKTEYRQIVLQLKENFLGNAFESTPEFDAIHNLFERSAMGLSFHGSTKSNVAARLNQMQSLKHFEQLLTLLKIFDLLAESTEFTQLNEVDTSVKLFLDDKIRMGSVYQYIHKNYNTDADVNRVAERVHLSTPAFCRYFKKQTRMTFTEFVNQYRITQAKTLLLRNATVSEACYEVGFESLSYFNKLFKKIVGENPSVFRKRYTR